jgi:site-specific DNA-methyltransferase (adenine-specific)
LFNEDCLITLPFLQESSVDAVVTDPPYALGEPNSGGFGKSRMFDPRTEETKARRKAGFMGRKWDNPDVAFSIGTWEAVKRVMKPGAYLLAFGGTRTWHRLTCAIEDAGLEIRNTVMWLYLSGFPKSKASLKPAWEPIIMARKLGPLYPLNIDGCKVSGRWPANLILDEEAGALLDAQTGERKGSSLKAHHKRNMPRLGTNTYGHDAGDPESASNGRDYTPDTGGASRFFYCPKATKKDREEGLDHLEPVHRCNGNKWTDQDYRVSRGERLPGRESGPRRNNHPTVKPTPLIRWLCRLITPPDGVVLDPFMGSGTTGKACGAEGFRFIGIDNDREHGYYAIARARIAHAYNSASVSESQ